MTTPLRYSDLRRKADEELQRERDETARKARLKSNVDRINRERESSELGQRFGAAFDERVTRGAAAITDALGFDEKAADLRRYADAIDAEYAPAQTFLGNVAGATGTLAPDLLAMVGSTAAVGAVARGAGTAARVAQRVLGPTINKGEALRTALPKVLRQNVGGAAVAAPLITVPGALSDDPYDSSVGSIAEASRQFREAGWEPTSAADRAMAMVGRGAEALDKVPVVGRLVGDFALDAGVGALLEGGVRTAARGVSRALPRTPDLREAWRFDNPTAGDLVKGDEAIARAEARAGEARARKAAEAEAVAANETFDGSPTPTAQATRQFDQTVTEAQAKNAERERRARMTTDQRAYLDRVDPVDDEWITRRRGDNRDLFAMAPAAAAAPMATENEDGAAPWELGALAFAGAAMTRSGRQAAARAAGDVASRLKPRPGMRGSFGESLYSRLGEAIATAPIQRGSAQEWRAHLSKNVPAGEREWTGVQKLLDEAAPDAVLTKEEIQAVANRFPVRVAADEYEYTRPETGAAALAEARARADAAWDAVDALPMYNGRAPAEELAARQAVHDEADQAQAALDALESPSRETTYHDVTGRVGGGERADDERYFEDVIRLEGHAPRFRSDHWSEPNVLMHVRGRVEDTPDGRAVLVEETQSDWHQQGREYGYRTPEGDARRADFQRRHSETAIAFNQRPDVRDLRMREMQADNEARELNLRLTDIRMAERYKAPDPEEVTRIQRRLADLRDEAQRVRSQVQTLRDAAFEALDSERVGDSDGHINRGPYEKTSEWTELGIKKALDRAVRAEAEWLVFPRGAGVSEAQGKMRYPREVVLTPDAQGRLTAAKGDGEELPTPKNGLDPRDLDKYLGPSKAQAVREQLAANPSAPVRVTPDEGMSDLKWPLPGDVGYYDGVVPNVLRDYAKVIGARVEPAPRSMGAGYEDAPAIRITPELKERLTREGQRLWAGAAAPVAGAAAAGDQENWEITSGAGMAGLFATALATRGKGVRAAARAAAQAAGDAATAARSGVRGLQEAASTHQRFGWIPGGRTADAATEARLVAEVTRLERRSMPLVERAVAEERDGLGMFDGAQSPMSFSRFNDGLSDDEIRKVLAVRGLARGQAAQMSYRTPAPDDAPMPIDGVRGVTQRNVLTLDSDEPMTAEQADVILRALADEGLLGGTFDPAGGALLIDNVKRYTSLDDAAFDAAIARAVARDDIPSLRRAVDPIFVEYLDGPADYLQAIGRDAEALLGVRSALDELEPVYAAHARAVGADPAVTVQRFREVRESLAAALKQMEAPPPEGNPRGVTVGKAAQAVYRRFPRLRSTKLEALTEPMVTRLDEMVQDLVRDGVITKEMAADWYKGAGSVQEQIARLVVPELRNDPDRVLYHIVNAIASSGQEVPIESRVGLQVFDQFQRTGRFSILDPESEEYRAGIAHLQDVAGGKKGIAAPRGRGLGNQGIQSSTRSLNIEQSYARLDALIQQYGKEGAVERLLAYVPVKGKGGVRQELALTELFGPKIGRYAGDKLGLPAGDQSTIDLWMSRMDYALRGDPSAIRRGDKLNDHVSASQRQRMQAVLAEYARRNGMPDSSAQALAWYAIKYAFRKAGAREKRQAYATLGSATLNALVDPRPFAGDVVQGKRLVGTAPGATGVPGWSSDTPLAKYAARTEQVIEPREGPFAGARFGKGVKAFDASGAAVEAGRAILRSPAASAVTGAVAGAAVADEGDKLEGAAAGAALLSGISGAGRVIGKAAAKGAVPPTPKGAPAGVSPTVAPPAPGGGAAPPPRMSGVLREAPTGSPKLDEQALNPSLTTLDPEGTRVTAMLESELLREGYRRGKVTDAELGELAQRLDPDDFTEGDVRNLDAVRVVALARRGQRNRELYVERLAKLDDLRGSGTAQEVAQAEAELDALMKQMMVDDRVLNQSATDLGRGLRLFSKLASMRGTYGALEHTAKKVLGTDTLNPKLQETLGRIAGAQNMTPEQKSLAVQKALADASKVGKWELATGARRAWLLSAIPSHIVNAMGSTSEAGVKQAVIHPVMAAMDRIYAGLTGQERVAAMSGRLGAYGAGFRRGVKKGFRKEMFQGLDPERPLDQLRQMRASYVASLGLEPEAGESAFRKTLRGAAQVIQTADDAILGLMGAMDRPFYEAALGASLAERSHLRALREGLEEGTPAYAKRMQELSRLENVDPVDATMAVVEAMDETFKNAKITPQGAEQGTSLPGAMLNGALTFAANKAPDFESGIRGTAQFVLPFVNTPSNLVRKGLEYVPGLGLALGAAQTKMLKQSLTKLGLPEAEMQKALSREGRRKMLETLSRQLVGGGGLVMAGYLLSKAGILSGEFTSPMGRTPEERDEAAERALTGQPAMSIRIGNRAHQLTGLAQFIAPLAVGHALAKIDDPMSVGGAGRVMAGAARATGRAMTELPMLQGVKDVTETLEGGRSLSEYAARQAASFTPYGAAVAMTARMSDPIGPRDPETPWEVVKERFPIARRSVPPKVGPFGEVTPRTSLAELAFAPTRPARIRRGPLVEGGEATYDDLVRLGFTPGAAQRLEGEDGWEYAARRAREGAVEKELLAGILEGDPGAWAFTTPLMRERFGEQQDWEGLLRAALRRQRSAVTDDRKRQLGQEQR